MSQRNKFIHPAQALNYYQNYAGMYYNLEEYQTCLIAMDTLLQMKKQYAPNDVYSINKAKIIMANCHYELGNYKKAINIYDEIIADHRAAFGNKGNADLEAGMQKILALAEMDLYDKLIKLHAEVKTDIDERMGMEDPFHLQNHKALIKALLTLNRHGEAEELIKKQMEQDLNVEDNFQYRSLLATCYFQQEKIDEAEKIYQQLKNEPDLTLAMTNALENLEKLMNQ
jgi:tetratricopeptide (TPR) repeat protein